MLAAIALVSDSNSNSDDDVREGPIVAPDAMEQQQQVNLVRLQDGIPIYLWRRCISFLTVREQAVSVRGMSRFFHECSDVYMQNFWSEPILHLPQDARSLARAMEMCQYLMRQEGYVEGITFVVELGSDIYEVEGSCEVSGIGTYQKMLSVPCDNLSFVGKGEGETIVHGGFVFCRQRRGRGRKVHFEGLTMKNPSGFGLVVSGTGTEIFLQKVTVEECQDHGVSARGGAKLVATGCQFFQNGEYGVSASGSTTTARFTNCTFSPHQA